MGLTVGEWRGIWRLGVGLTVGEWRGMMLREYYTNGLKQPKS